MSADQVPLIETLSVPVFKTDVDPPSLILISASRTKRRRSAPLAYDEDDPAQGSEPARRYEGLRARPRATMHVSPPKEGSR